MAKIDYNFDLGRPSAPSGGRGWERRVRVALLFCIVAVITAVVIYALIPRKPAKPLRRAEDLPSSRAAATDPAATPGGPAAIPPSASGTTTAPAGDHEGTPSPAGEKPEAVQVNPAARTAAATSETAPRPVKGQVGPGDPPPEQDQARRDGTRDTAGEAALTALLKAGDYPKFFSEAQRMVTAAPENSAARAGLGEVLTAGRRQVWRSGAWRRLETTHPVVSGNNLSSLARRYHTTVAGIRYGNKLRSNDIRIGQKLSIIPGPWKVTVAKNARLLTLWRKNAVYAVFPVGIGRQDSTPVGSFVICHRQYHPRYRDPQGRVFKYGDSRNPLGAAFLALARPETPKKPYRGYGIHGTSEQVSVGRSVSSGCIRMHNDDAMMLYYLLSDKTPVEITE